MQEKETKLRSFISFIALLCSPALAEHDNITGAWQQVLKLEEPQHTIHENIDARPEYDLFLLYTRSNPLLGQVITYSDVNSLTSSNFNPNVPTVIVVHGWLENMYSPLNPTVRYALLRNSDINVIYMDWSRYSQLDYISSVIGVPSVGRGLGMFVAFLAQVTRMSLDSVHLVGFSLGGHVVGNAGRLLKGQVARITALDPAGPMWYYNHQRLRSTDARYVEVIHTNAGGLGLMMTVGDTDFFPNGGNTQPGCVYNDVNNVVCSHYRSYELFASSINRDKFVGRQCRNLVMFLAGFCIGNSMPMGNNDLSKNGTGVYRLNTKSTYPY